MTKARLKINELENGPVLEGTVMPRKGSPSPLDQRKKRRRLDLRTVDGTVRESIRVYRELAQGEISLGEAEVRGRQLRRHLDLLVASEQAAQLSRIEESLRQLQGGRIQPALPAPSQPAELPAWAREDL